MIILRLGQYDEIGNIFDFMNWLEREYFSRVPIPHNLYKDKYDIEIEVLLDDELKTISFNMDVIDVKEKYGHIKDDVLMEALEDARVKMKGVNTMEDYVTKLNEIDIDIIKNSNEINKLQNDFNELMEEYVKELNGKKSFIQSKKGLEGLNNIRIYDRDKVKAYFKGKRLGAKELLLFEECTGLKFHHNEEGNGYIFSI